MEIILVFFSPAVNSDQDFCFFPMEIPMEIPIAIPAPIPNYISIHKSELLY